MSLKGKEICGTIYLLAFFFPFYKLLVEVMAGVPYGKEFKRNPSTSACKLRVVFLVLFFLNIYLTLIT